MLYNTDHLRTAGKVTVYTTLLGVLIFATIFIFNLGEKEIKSADAQSSGTATTSVFVVNTPPVWTATTTELVESSIANPTNVDDVISWVAVGTDSNAEDYWLLICSTNASATASSSSPPTCNGGTQWAVSATTTSGTLATATTTVQSGWAESNPWFGFICDGNGITPRCNSLATQGTNATNSSPFEVNHRPTFTVVSDPVSGIPGQGVTFTTTSDDPDTSGGAQTDQVYLRVCSTSGYNTVTNTCDAITLATSTVYVDNDASATYTIVIPTQDTNFTVYPFIIDTHGFEAQGGEHGQAVTLTVNNVAPTVTDSSITINGGNDMILTTEAGLTTGFTLSFTTSDNNSCDAFGGVDDDEITGFDLALYRSGIGASGCLATSTLNANNCYPSGAAPSSWDLVCTPDLASCTGLPDTDMIWNCTFPLWYIADPTGNVATATPYLAENWRAQVRGTDTATSGPYTEGLTGKELLPLLAFSLNTPSINYGNVEPGQATDPLNGTTTIAATGNVGLDKDVEGASMCSGYTNASPCLPSLTSTIPESDQRFATSKVAYTSATPLSSTTAQEIEVNVKKTIATSSQQVGSAYWGIYVPGTIAVAGAYTGRNIITARVGETAEWY